MNWPHDPLGDNPLIRFCRVLLGAARACEVKPGVGYKVRRTSSGTLLEIQPPSAIQTAAMFPFKIYPYTDPDNPTAAWRTFRVRAGSLFIKDAQGIFLDETTNTDGVDDPWSDSLTTRANGTEIAQIDVQHFTCAEDEITYFWVELDDSAEPTTGTIHAHIDPASDGWDSWPDFDATHIEIGNVDTSVALSSQKALVDYVQYGNIVRPPTKRLKVCEDDGTQPKFDFYAFPYTPPELTADSTAIKADNTDITADQT